MRDVIKQGYLEGFKHQPLVRDPCIGQNAGQPFNENEIPHEWLMFETFKISLLDDITHGISGLLGLIALVLGYKWTVKFLMLVGGYYALDALFFVVNGFATGQGFIDNMLLNGPHIGIAVVVFYALHTSVKNIELA